MRRLVLLLSLAVLGTPAAAQAGEKIYSYDPADAATKARVDNGLTFIFDKSLLGFNVKTVLATQAKAEADLRPADERELKTKLDRILPSGAHERALYAVLDKEQGLAMVKAFCPGSTKGWLVFSTLQARTGAVVHALGDDPATGQARLCTTLNFNFRGEWALPRPPGEPRPDLGPIGRQ